MTTERVAPIRLLAACVILLVIPVGLFARSHRAGAVPATLFGFLATYTGDTLWPIMFFFIGRIFFPTADRWAIAVFTLLLTLSLEFGQLWQPPLLQWLREQPVIGFMLGNSFLWSDFACLLVGCVIAISIDAILPAFLKRT